MKTGGRAWRVTLLCWTLLIHCAAVYAVDYEANQYSTGILTPPDFWSFRPPPVGQTFDCPVFGTEIHVLSAHHSVVGWNGERAHFSPDDRYFVVGVQAGGAHTWLYDGRTGAFIKSLPISNSDSVRWGYHPKILFYFTGRQVRGYNVETDADTLVHQFAEPIALCGGDGNDFDDNGEWILLNFGLSKGLRLFAFNVRTGETRQEWDVLAPEADIDYATVTPSGGYVAVLGRGSLASLANPYSGTGVYDLDGNFIRQIAPFHGHTDFGYLNGTNECIITKGWGETAGTSMWPMNPAAPVPRAIGEDTWARSPKSRSTARWKSGVSSTTGPVPPGARRIPGPTNLSPGSTMREIDSSSAATCASNRAAPRRRTGTTCS